MFEYEFFFIYIYILFIMGKIKKSKSNVLKKMRKYCRMELDKVIIIDASGRI